jgi:hypothetical protein
VVLRREEVVVYVVIFVVVIVVVIARFGRGRKETDFGLDDVGGVEEDQTP